MYCNANTNTKYIIAAVAKQNTKNMDIHVVK
jgi:hypothetical protein